MFGEMLFLVQIICPACEGISSQIVAHYRLRFIWGVVSIVSPHFPARVSSWSDRCVGVLLRLFRPLLLLHFALYKSQVTDGPFPLNASTQTPTSPIGKRLLFFGDVAVAGYGVLDVGMATPAQTASILSASHGRRYVWDSVAAIDLTAAQAAGMPESGAGMPDAVVIMLGVPDVLLVTSTTSWTASLEQITARLTGTDVPCRIVFAAIPPMADFQPIPALARRLITTQITRLNNATEALSDGLDNAVFVPFPQWRVGDMFIQKSFSWRRLHQMWAETITTVGFADHETAKVNAAQPLTSDRPLSRRWPLSQNP